MEQNITTLINTDERENNHQLFTPVKNKFDAKKSTEVVATSPSKFNIPILKIPVGTTLENTQTSQPNTSTQLNQFLIKQLQEKHNNDLCTENTGFVLPQLQSSTDSNKGSIKFKLPNLKPQTTSNVSKLTTAINKLKVTENSSENEVKSVISPPIAIDLTTALSAKLGSHQGTPPTRDLIKSRQDSNDIEFEIPFIDCDRVDIAKKHAILVPVSNEYCVTDVSQLLLDHSLAEPSAVGRFFNTNAKKYLEPLPLKYFTPQFRQQKVKHCVKPFHFETLSPDDVVLLALSKYQRRHYN